MLFSQDIVGSYKLHGLYIIHQNIARYDSPVLVQDIYELGLSFPLYTIQAGEIYRTTYQGPYGHIQATAAEVILYVNFNEDGTGGVPEGSFYPMTVVDPDYCIATDAALPITDNFTYFVDLYPWQDHIIPAENILGYVPNENTTVGFTENGIPIGYEHPLPFQGKAAGSISLAGSGFLDTFPLNPFNPTICDGTGAGSGNCFDVILPNGEVIVGGDPLPGMTAGYVKKGCLPINMSKV